MLKNLKVLGKTLTKEQQRTVSGGFGTPCRTNKDCLLNDPYAFPGDYSCRHSRFGYGRVCVAN